MARELLVVDGLDAGYDGKTVVRDVSRTAQRGEGVTLIGPNGAGKSTVLRAISGLIEHAGGSVELNGRSMAGLPPHKVATAGLSLVPENRSLFRSLTVRENLMVPGGRGSARGSVKKATALFPELDRLLDRKAGLLSGGEQQMLAISRALVVEPDLVVVDEMSMGLAPIVVQRILRVLREVADGGEVGVLVVEQHIPLILPKADRAYILVHGELVYDGPAETLRRDPTIVASTYLGSDQVAEAAAIH